MLNNHLVVPVWVPGEYKQAQNMYSNDNKSDVFFYLLFLQTVAQSPLQSKEQKHSQNKQTIHMHVRTHAHTHTQTHTHTHTHKHTHTPQARTHTHTHTHTHTRTHAHTHTLSFSRISRRSGISEMIWKMFRWANFTRKAVPDKRCSIRKRLDKASAKTKREDKEWKYQKKSVAGGLICKLRRSIK